MLVDLEQEVLENIVKDGIKEIIGRVVGGKRDKKQKAWFKGVKTVLDEYQQKLKKDFLPVLVNDFSKKIEVKFRGGNMSEEDKDRIREFMEMVRKSNTKSIVDELMRKLETLKGEGENGDLVENIEGVKATVLDGHQWILERLVLYVRSVIEETMFKKSVERSRIEVMLYNFVEGDVPNSVNKLFQAGMDAVPSTRMTKKEVDKRVEDALLEFLMRLGRRRIYGYSRVLQASGVQDWIDKVKKMNIDQEYKNFVDTLENTLPALRTEMELVYVDVQLDTKEEMVKKLEKEGCVLVLCDKGMGMSLFTLETMRKADESLMNQLGAIRIEKTKEEVVQMVIDEIRKFEDGLTAEQREYLDNMCRGRHDDLRKTAFPFLKSMHKVQKMTEEQIMNKDVSGIKFRPVVDAKQWLTRSYAGVAMLMMREACNMLVRKGVIKEVKPKDGWRFAVEARDYTVEKEFDVMVTADIEEAYTNISDEMIKKAIEIVCRAVKVKEWTIDLMKKLVDLVLDQNYAETSGGLFKFKKVLPMGYKLSGEALDIVALAEEIEILQHLGEQSSGKHQGRIGELRNYPEEFVDNSVETELSMSKAVTKFKRYVDDVHSQIAGTLDEVLKGILALGYMYPENLVLSMDLSIWNSTFLDVYLWKNLFSGEVSTVMKRRSGVPIGHVRKQSTHPEKYKLQSLMGEMLRGRRIASDKELVEASDKCTGYEFQSIGYSRREVQQAMEEARKKFDENYSGMFVKFPDEDGERRYFSYGGGLVHNKNYRYGEILVNYIENIKPAGEPGLVLLPDVKIKSLAYTKKRYLERQEEDLKKSKS